MRRYIRQALIPSLLVMVVIGIFATVKYVEYTDSCRSSMTESDIGRRLATLVGDTVYWSPDSIHLATSSHFYSLNDESGGYLIDTPIDTRADRLPYDIPRKIVWNTTGTQLILVGHEVRLWDGTEVVVLTEEARYRYYPDAVWHQEKVVVVSHGLTTADNKIWIWDADSRELVGVIQGDNTNPEANSMGFIGFMSVESIPRSDNIITSSFGNNINILWDVRKLEAVTLPTMNTSGSVLFSVNVHNNMIAVLDNNSRELSILPTLHDEVIHMDYDASNYGIQGLSWGQNNNLLLVRKRRSGLPSTDIIIRDVLDDQIVRSINFCTRGQIFASWHPTDNLITIISDQRDALMWDLDTNQISSIHIKDVQQAIWSPDGKKLALVTSAGLIYIYEYEVD